jgi:uncharacterized protein (DUF2141 family)
MAKGSTATNRHSMIELWRENHGNLLVSMLALILIVGSVIMLVQNRNRRAAPIPRPLGVGDLSTADEETDPLLLGDDNSIATPAANDVLPADSALLLIHIEGLESERGVVRIALYSDPTTFNQPELADQKTELKIFGGEATWEVQVPANKAIAISAYHDQNNNDRLDKNFIGIPVEKYGFSKGTRSPRGPPDFADAAFEPQPGVVDVPLQVW